jgi:5'-methylthioadenosine phosphorylase
VNNIIIWGRPDLENIKFAIIGGTGAFKTVNRLDKIAIDTKYGKVTLEIIEFHGKKVVLLKRHGFNHSIPPHRINYRANIMALKMIGVKNILATAAVGSLNKKFRPGELVLISDFLDFTYGRENTFFDGTDQKVVHVDMSNPYCLNLRNYIYKASQYTNLPIHNKGAVYVCTQGPRFETPAEISMYRSMGADVVGMTSVPEVILAREAEICYASVAIVTNYAAGITSNILTHQEVLDRMQEASVKIELLFRKTIEMLDINISCSCHSAVISQTNL